MKKAIASAAAMFGLILMAGEPLPGQEISMTAFVVPKIIGIILFVGGLFFSGAFRREFYSDSTNN